MIRAAFAIASRLLMVGGQARPIYEYFLQMYVYIYADRADRI
jgi:hypothetical protein